MIFFLIAISIMVLSYTYIGYRILIPASLHSPWNIIAWTLLIIFMILPPLSFIVRFYGYETWWGNLLSWITYLSMGFFFLVFLFLAIRDLVWLLAGVIKTIISFVQSLFTSEAKQIKSLDLERRHFLIHSINFGILGISGILTGYGLFEARRRALIKEVSIPIPNLHRDLKDFRIVQITDIHAGLTVKRNFVQNIVNQVNELSADVIVFTGDAVDGSVPNLKNDVAPLAELSARYGCYFVTGNHEYYSGVKAWLVKLNRLGFTILQNEHRILQHGSGRILLAGVTDYNAGQFIKSHTSDPRAAISKAPPSHVKILLAHQPRNIFIAARVGFDLQISGHTHGGQFFPWNFIASLQQPYVAGLHKYKNTWIYVSRGTGYWGPPMRLAARSEITLIKLTTA